MEENNWQNNGMGGMAMGKCEDGQIKSLYNETKFEHFQGWYGGLQFGNVYTCNGLFQKTCEFQEVDSKAFFHKLIEQFINRGFANTWEFAIHIIHESLMTNLCNSR
jgi:hypothetical protein